METCAKFSISVFLTSGKCRIRTGTWRQACNSSRQLQVLSRHYCCWVKLWHVVLLMCGATMMYVTCVCTCWIDIGEHIKMHPSVGVVTTASQQKGTVYMPPEEYKRHYHRRATGVKHSATISTLIDRQAHPLRTFISAPSAHIHIHPIHCPMHYRLKTLETENL